VADLNTDIGNRQTCGTVKHKAGNVTRSKLRRYFWEWSRDELCGLTVTSDNARERNEAGKAVT